MFVHRVNEQALVLVAVSQGDPADGDGDAPGFGAGTEEPATATSAHPFRVNFALSSVEPPRIGFYLWMRTDSSGLLTGSCPDSVSLPLEWSDLRSRSLILFWFGPSRTRSTYGCGRTGTLPGGGGTSPHGSGKCISHAPCYSMRRSSAMQSRVQGPAGGPDVLIEHAGRRIWVEAVSATDGEAGKPDSVTQPELGKASTVPDEKIILRYRSAIGAKHVKHADYLSSGIVSPDDPYIIAVNGYAISYRWADGEMPRILKAVFPLGHLQFLIDRNTRKLTGSQHQFRPNICKLSGAAVSTDLFTGRHCGGISAVLHSYANACMTAQPLAGTDFLLIHNPLAANPLPRKLIRSRREYTATPDEDGYSLEYDETDELARCYEARDGVAEDAGVGFGRCCSRAELQQDWPHREAERVGRDRNAAHRAGPA